MILKMLCSLSLIQMMMKFNAHSLVNIDSICASSNIVNLSDHSQAFAHQSGKWASALCVSHGSLSGLLAILKTAQPDLPKDARILLSTPSSMETGDKIQELSGGSYYHFGIEKGIRACLEQNLGNRDIRSVKIQINVNGVSILSLIHI